MKKTIIKLISLVMGAIILLLCLSSCSKEPYEYDLDEFIEVPDILDNTVVTDEQIKLAVAKQIQTARENKATLEVVSMRGAIPGDIVTVSIKCYRYVPERKLVSEISDDNATIALGQGKYPAELENALISIINRASPANTMSPK